MRRDKAWACTEAPGWPVDRLDVHIHPLDDQVAHLLRADCCVCGPSVEVGRNQQGKVYWLVKHASLDGRELLEQGRQIRKET